MAEAAAVELACAVLEEYGSALAAAADDGGAAGGSIVHDVANNALLVRMPTAAGRAKAAEAALALAARSSETAAKRSWPTVGPLVPAWWPGGRMTAKAFAYGR